MRMLSFKKSYLFILFILVLMPLKSFAQLDRLNAFTADRTQLQAAMAAANKVEDEPLDDPEIEIPLINELAIISEESKIEEDVQDALVPITLEESIQQQIVQKEIELFGYDIFSTIPSTFAPVEGIPVPPDYLIGPGDTFLLKIFGAIDVEYRLVVTREGKLLVPEVGELQLAGLTFTEAKDLIADEVGDSRVGAKTIVTLADLHTIQILMVGEVTRPGSFTVSGLSSLLNTLITTGGIKRSGSLRNIQVRRAGQVVASMDIYELLLSGNNHENIYLRQGDVIFVPPIGKTVSIVGEVLRPAIYELKTEANVEDLLNLSGGLLAKAAPSKSHIERIISTGSKTLLSLDVSNPEDQKIKLENGDILRVFPVLNKMDNVVILTGDVLEPGGYEWHPKMKVADLIRSRDNLRQSVDFSIGVIQRENNIIKRFEALYFDLGKALQNPQSYYNIELKPRDKVWVFNINTNRSKALATFVDRMQKQATPFEPAQTFFLRGSFSHTGEFPLPKNMRLLDATVIGGGISPDIDLDYVLLVREDINTGKIQFTHLNARDAHNEPRGDHNPVIQPRDVIYVFDRNAKRTSIIAKDIDRLRTQSNYKNATKIVSITGNASNTGVYPLTPGMTVNDLLIAAGGITEKAFGYNATLSRREEVDGEFTKTDHYDINLASLTVDGFDKNLVLQPYDQLQIREKPEWIESPSYVQLEGEIRYPGKYQVGKRDTLCDVIQRAGGFTEDAYLFGSVFTRESVRKREQDGLDKFFDELDDQLVDVHLSPGFNKDTKLPVNNSAIDELKIIKQLKRTKASGRMVIDLENAVAQCKENSDLVLEDGDRLVVPKFANEVSVVGQVYFPTSHVFRNDRAALDYINLSGGTKEFAQREHIFVVQANGEVMTLRSPLSTWGWALAPSNIKVTPGSTIYVPLSLDRINGREFAQSWADLFYKVAVSAASVDYLFK